jgi:hypothetical protein
VLEDEIRSNSVSLLFLRLFLFSVLKNDISGMMTYLFNFLKVCKIIKTSVDFFLRVRKIVGLSLSYSKAIVVDIGFCLQVRDRQLKPLNHTTTYFF